MAVDENTVVDGENPGSGEPLKPFMAQYSPDLKTNEYLAELGGHTEVAKTLLDFKGKLDNAVIKPSTEASEEEWNAYYTALGRPGNPEGYELSGNYDENVLAEFKKQAFEAGVPKQAAEKIFQWYDSIEAQRQEAYAEARKAELEKASEGLKESWGDKYEENSQYVRKAYEAFIPPEIASKLDEPGPDGVALGNSPWFMELMLRVGKEVAGDSLPTGTNATLESEAAFLKRRYPNSPELFGGA